MEIMLSCQFSFFTPSSKILEIHLEYGVMKQNIAFLVLFSPNVVKNTRNTLTSIPGVFPLSSRKNSSKKSMFGIHDHTLLQVFLGFFPYFEKKSLLICSCFYFAGGLLKGAGVRNFFYNRKNFYSCVIIDS